MKNNNNIESLYVKYFSGNATEDEIQIIHAALSQSEQNRIDFEELRNIWEVNHPAFEPSEIDVVDARQKLISSLRFEPRTNTVYRTIRSYWKYAAAVALIPLLIASFFIFKDACGSDALSEVVYKEIISPAGRITSLILADGTKVTLNANSKLTYLEAFSGNQRNVTLEGEGYFEVAHNAAKPFIVHTEKMDIHVLGTKFNINAYADLSEVKTTLEEGKVKIIIPKKEQNLNDDSYYLIPNQELALNIVTGDILKHQVDAEESKGWMNGGLVFNSTLLIDVLKQISRKYNIKIECNSTNNLHKRITVRFESEYGYEDILDGLKMMMPDLKITKTGEISYLVDLAD